SLPSSTASTVGTRSYDRSSHAPSRRRSRCELCPHQRISLVLFPRPPAVSRRRELARSTWQGEHLAPQHRGAVQLETESAVQRETASLALLQTQIQSGGPPPIESFDSFARRGLQVNVRYGILQDHQQGYLYGTEPEDGEGISDTYA